MVPRDFHFDLPPELIAQHPVAERSESRLLVIQRGSGEISHHQFRDISQFLRPDDLVILNDSRVIPARLRGHKTGTHGILELLLVEEISPLQWWALLRPGKRVHAGTRLQIDTPQGVPSALFATIITKDSQGRYRLEFEGVADLNRALDTLGEIPLPPYIRRTSPAITEEDSTRYQTVYARADGSVAAPTAGLHLTDEVLTDWRRRGIEIHFVTLHVGYGTFAPIKAERIEDHVMHEERFEVPEVTARAVSQAKADGRRVIAVGTTSVRVLESVARTHGGTLVAGRGRTNIFLYPPASFQVVDGLLTNFHLSESTLLMLVSAFAAPGRDFAGRDLVLRAYAEAIRERYRFFSYGDATLLI
ncbi:MAG TPA: tRNA preQ1(34) S-adenosylmethionine ribosyltransferase-isomerase QueA [Verrucomicrobiota bacterium]|nr:tRNA preQ1(34) S-adenosylmethionine ribosyltransferase-isomerase QueA [Verrucomicrobiota bacterium]